MFVDRCKDFVGGGSKCHCSVLGFARGGAWDRDWVGEKGIGWKLLAPLRRASASRLTVFLNG